jgi:hypothetical protein
LNTLVTRFRSFISKIIRNELLNILNNSLSTLQTSKNGSISLPTDTEIDFIDENDELDEDL